METVSCSAAQHDPYLTSQLSAPSTTRVLILTLTHLMDEEWQVCWITQGAQHHIGLCLSRWPICKALGPLRKTRERGFAGGQEIFDLITQTQPYKCFSQWRRTLGCAIQRVLPMMPLSPPLDQTNGSASLSGGTSAGPSLYHTFCLPKPSNQIAFYPTSPRQVKSSGSSHTPPNVSINGLLQPLFVTERKPD